MIQPDDYVGSTPLLVSLRGVPTWTPLTEKTQKINPLELFCVYKYVIIRTSTDDDRPLLMMRMIEMTRMMAT